MILLTPVAFLWRLSTRGWESFHMHGLKTRRECWCWHIRAVQHGLEYPGYLGLSLKGKPLKFVTLRMNKNFYWVNQESSISYDNVILKWHNGYPMILRLPPSTSLYRPRSSLGYHPVSHQYVVPASAVQTVYSAPNANT